MRTGVIGLGAMGAPMALNLHRAGLLGAVWNRSAGKAAALAASTGCSAATSPADLASRVDAILICVSADQDVLDIIEQMKPGLHPGQCVADFSTVSAGTARGAAAQLAPLGVDFLDTPVSGGVEGARNGQLAIMVGGDKAALEKLQPVLSVLGRVITHFGGHGAGQAAKATNQIMVAGIIRAVAEAMAFADAQQLPLDRIVATLSQGAAGSWYFANRAPFMIRGEYPAGFRVRLHAKDLKICRDMAAQLGAHLPVVEDVLREYQQLIEAGHADEDISALYRLKRALF
ncbi:MAG: NAD(P)-dependent oxidoreductase [Steroidobacteraceae bacterium]